LLPIENSNPFEKTTFLFSLMTVPPELRRFKAPKAITPLAKSLACVLRNHVDQLCQNPNAKSVGNYVRNLFSWKELQGFAMTMKPNFRDHFGDMCRHAGLHVLQSEESLNWLGTFLKEILEKGCFSSIISPFGERFLTEACIKQKSDISILCSRRSQLTDYPHPSFCNFRQNLHLQNGFVFAELLGEPWQLKRFNQFINGNTKIIVVLAAMRMLPMHLIFHKMLLIRMGFIARIFSLQALCVDHCTLDGTTPSACVVIYTRPELADRLPSIKLPLLDSPKSILTTHLARHLYEGTAHEQELAPYLNFVPLRVMLKYIDISECSFDDALLSFFRHTYEDAYEPDSLEMDFEEMIEDDFEDEFLELEESLCEINDMLIDSDDEDELPLCTCPVDEERSNCFHDLIVYRNCAEHSRKVETV
jgi:hypothetical protein